VVDNLPGLNEAQPLKKFPEGMKMILPGFHRRIATDKRQELVTPPGAETKTRKVLDDHMAVE